MNETQKAILEIARKQNIASLTLRELGTMVGVGEKPAIIQHHLTQLERKGFLRVDRKNKKAELLFEKQDDRLVRIPVLGSANCGEALNYPSEYAESYLTVSKELLKNIRGTVVVAFKATGDSMNRAEVTSVSGAKAYIEDGDYVLINTSELSNVRDDSIVLSSIDGMANIKKIKKGEHGVVLLSESTKDYPPIYIDESEQQYFVQGVVIGVVKT